MASVGHGGRGSQDWDEAERCYKQSLGINEQLGNLAHAARSYNQLALVAKGAGRLEEAERWYRKAIELKEEVGNLKNLPLDLNNLANLLLAQTASTKRNSTPGRRPPSSHP
ncbi:MAG: tetratricopeptide repeat protein [Chloroflexi bacterium]|nr:tetratricopeptide repeat protein [Chloroflexota bacterium]